MLRSAPLWISLSLAAATLLSFSACAPASNAPESEELTGAPEDTGKNEDAISGTLAVGSTLIATTDVNLRTGPSTSYSILHVIPNGATVTVVASTAQNGFYKVKHNGTTGWSYGTYFKAGSPPPSMSSSSSTSSSGAGGSSGGGLHADAIARAQSGMGFSYWWGHGRFRTAGASSSTAGTCSGSCPSCSHSGSYGGDCSGFVAKVWQVPSSNNDITVDSHPYSTGNFVSDTSQWSTVSRSSLQTADALVYNSGGAGHIFLYSSGDGWGSMDAYECKGCSYGCVHNLRTATSAYHAIRRAGY